MAAGHSKRWLFGAVAAALVAAGVVTAQRADEPPLASVLVPVVGYAAGFAVSPPVFEFAADPPATLVAARFVEAPPATVAAQTDAPPSVPVDDAIQSLNPIAEIRPPTFSFDGLSSQDVADSYGGNRTNPPSVNGDVGLDRYVQAVNGLVRVYVKTGDETPLATFKLSALWVNAGDTSVCSTNNDGDATVLYDHLAAGGGRWLLSQMAITDPATGPYSQCIAVSQTSDPAGADHLYRFNTPGGYVNRSSKFGVWPDGYYMADNQFTSGGVFKGVGAFAFDRQKMTAGDPAATFIYFNAGTLFTVGAGLRGMLPADLDGQAPPDTTATSTPPNYFAMLGTPLNYFIPGGAAGSMRLFAFHADFAAPAASTFTERPGSPIALAPYDTRNPTGRHDIEQPGPATSGAYLDAVQDRLMARLTYRYSSTPMVGYNGSILPHESLVVTHTVNVGVDPATPFGHQAAVRYYELRRLLTSGVFTAVEQATFAPDNNNRWLGSAAMDRNGNLAVGYTVSGPFTYPSIRYAGRLLTDPPKGLYQGEGEVAGGSGVQLDPSGAWGESTGLTIDPVDDCTFWITAPYYTAVSQASSAMGWLTRIGTFRFQGCGSPAGTLSGRVIDGATNAAVQKAKVTITPGNLTTYTNANGFYTQSLAPSTYTVTVTAPQYGNVSLAGVNVIIDDTTTRDFVLPKAPAITAHPTSRNIPEGQNTTFAATAEGFPAPTYQWQVSMDSGASWSDLTDAPPHSGVTTATLAVTSVAGAMTNARYRVLATNAVGDATSRPATLTINGAPGFTTQPKDTGAIESEAAIFKVVVTGTPAPTLQWQSSTDGTLWTDLADSTTYAGVTTSTLAVSNTTLSQDGLRFRVVAANPIGTATSVPARLSVAAAGPPVIAKSPISQAVTVSQNGMFIAEAVGLPAPTFQWQVSIDDGASWTNVPAGLPYRGQASPTLTILAVTPGLDDSKYRVLVANSAGAVISEAATLDVVQKLAVVALAGEAGTPGSADGPPSVARFDTPSAVATDTNGNVFVADTNNSTIRKIAPDGTVTTLAGQAGSTGSADGAGPAARFNNPRGIAVDPTGNVIVADAGNDTIRKIAPDGTVTTLAGQPGSAGSGDGVGTTARFNVPLGVAVDPTGNVIVADTGNSTIRKIATDGTVTTLAGQPGSTGTVDATGTAARFNRPGAVAVDPATGTIAVADTVNQTIREIAPGGAVTTLAGAPGTAGSTDGAGTAARFNTPSGVAFDPIGGSIIVADAFNQTIRSVTADGVVTTTAGLAGTQGSSDGTDNLARFDTPRGVAADQSGTVFVADTGNHIIRKGAPTGSPVFVTQPNDRSVSAGQTTTFNATAVGQPSPTRRWQVSTDGGETWVDLSDGAPYNGTTGPALQVSNVTVGLNGYQFRNVATNDVAEVVSNAATLTVTVPPSITTQPVNQSVTPAQTATFTVAASGTPAPTYQWQVSTNGGATFTSLANGAPYNGVATSTLTVTNPSVALNANLYRAVATNSAGSATSNAATLTINVAPAIITQPTNQTISVGQNGSFAVAASGTPTPTYQWQVSTNSGASFTSLVNAAPYSGVTTATLTITNATAGLDGNQYRAVATNSAGSATSNAATLTVTGGGGVAPAFTTQPTNQTVNSGSNTSWTVAVSGTPVPTLQWQVSSNDGVTFSNLSNTGFYSGVTTTTLTITGAAASIDGQLYRALATNSAGSATSDAGLLTVSQAGGYTFSTLAGVANVGAADGSGFAARFDTPMGMAVDSAGTVYIADAGNNTIRKMTATGVVTTLAGLPGTCGFLNGTGSTARFCLPQGVAVDGAGTVYVADSASSTIRKITPAGVVTTLAGSFGASGSADGTGPAAQFNFPSAIAVDSAGTTIYVADMINHTIRKITAAGVVTTLAGSPGLNGSADGTGSAARFFFPKGIAVDNAGTVYVADSQNSTIRKVTAAGVVTTLAGSGGFGGVDGIGAGAAFGAAEGVAVDSAGTVYVADTGNSTIRKITTGGVVTTLAGLTGASGAMDGTGSAARFDFPKGIAVNSAGVLYVSDTASNTIRQVTAAGAVTTPAGANGVGSANGTGSAARFDAPEGAAVDSAGNVYIADSNNHTIRKITPTGVVTTFAGSPGLSGSTDGTGSAARFANPYGVAVDSAGTVYVADTANQTIRKITPGGVVTTLAGTPNVIGGADGTGAAAQFFSPARVAVDSAGNVYVADEFNNTIRKVTAAGVVTTVAGLAGVAGFADGTGSAARFSGPQSVAVDSAGTIYVADTGNSTIRKITAAGVVTTLTGTTSCGYADGSGSAPRVCYAVGVAVDGAGTVYIADSGNDAIRQITTSGVMSTIGGLATFAGSADGTGSAARFSDPHGIAADSAGTIYIADSLNNTIRKGVLASSGSPIITTQPVSQTVSGGSNASFTVAASGTPAPTYQWQASIDAGLSFSDLTNSAPYSGVTTTTLAVTNATAGLTGYLFRAIATNTAGTAASDAATLTVDAGTAPGFVTQPSSQTVASGGNTAFVVSVSGTPAPTLQWQQSINSGVSWASLLNVGVYSGVTTATLAISNVTTLNGYQFRAVATNAAGSAISNTASLTLGTGVTFTFTTFAGAASGPGRTDGPMSTARFNFPVGVAVDAAGNAYVADTSNQTIRKISAGGVVTTLAGLPGTVGSADGEGSAARFASPYGVAVDGAGVVYVADTSNHTIRRITPAGIVTTIAGLAGTPGSANGTGSAARFANPSGVAVDSAGTLYVSDSLNHTIRTITPAGAVSTLAGTAGVAGSADGTGGAASFNAPRGVAVDSAGNVYVADTANATIRKVTPAGVVTTLAGTAGNTGSSDGTGSAAFFDGPYGVTVDTSGNVYVADTSNSTIRKVTPAGVVTTLAGAAGTAGSVDGIGTVARFYQPLGLGIDGTGNLYIADSYNNAIRLVSSAGVTTTLSVIGGSGSADGTASAARFYQPAGMAVDAAGAIYVADTSNYAIRKITAAGVVTTLAGLAGSLGSADGAGSTARFNYPFGIAVDNATGVVYVADTYNYTIRKITPAGVVTTLAGLAGSLGSADGTGSAARFSDVYGLAVDSSGNIYAADATNQLIRKITPAGVVTTLAGTLATTGSADGTGTAASFNFPLAIAVDSAGTVYVADTSNSTIREITSGGVVTTLAGTAASPGSADGTGSVARFNQPAGITVDDAGTLYVSDTFSFTIRRITTGGVVRTIAGLPGSAGSTDGTGSGARFYQPFGMAFDVAAGALYVADSFNHTIRRGTLATNPAFATQPASQIVTAGANVSFTAVASGFPVPTYQWQVSVNGGALFNDLTNAAPYSGVTTSTLTITGATLGLSTYQYRATASNSNGTAISSVATLTVTNPLTFSTLAGDVGNAGSADGTGSAAQFSTPGGTAVDSAGNVYVADANNSTIRKVTPGGVVTTLAGSAGVIGSANGTGAAASFFAPYGVAVDSAGTVYVADTNNNTIRKITAAGVVTTLAGSPGTNGSADGTGSAARFLAPYGIAVDSAGTLYVSDFFNYTIRKITAAGVVTTFAGLAGDPGSVDGAGSAARFANPHGVAVDAAGVVYVADGDTIRQITAGGIVTTLAGTAGSPGSADGAGSAAQFAGAFGVAVDGTGTLYVADVVNNTIRHITPAGMVTTVAGAAGTTGSTDGTGTGVRFSYPHSIAVDAAGAVYVADRDNHTIRKGTP